jgi:hypothetical protein
VTNAKRKPDYEFKLCSYNVRSLLYPGSVNSLILELRHYKCNVTAIQETRWRGADTVYKCNGFTVLSSGGRGGQFGTAFIVDANWGKHIIGWTPVSERICILRLRGRFFNYSIINVHAPHNGRPDEEKERFYSQLERAHDNCPKHDIKIVIGDFNAQVGREEIYRPVIGKYSLHRETNENGLRLITFATATNMRICSSFFMHKNIHKVTWVPPNGGRGTQIDHVLIDARHFSDVLDVRAFRSSNPDHDQHVSDHKMLGARLRARISNIVKDKVARNRNLALDKLKDQRVQQEYNSVLSTKLAETNNASSWSEYENIIKQTAEQVLGYTQRARNNWFDEECKEVTEKKILLLKRGYNRSRKRMEELKKARREEKRVHRRKKREYEKRILEELESTYSIRDTRKFYKKLNDQRKGFQPRITMIKKNDGEIVSNQTDVLEQWKQHFDELLNSDTPLEANIQPEIDREDGTIIPVPQIEEVATAITKLKNNKAPGFDNIPGELLKTGCVELNEVIHEFVKKVWREEKLPEEWMKGVICPIHKKGCKMTCQNYRGICLLPTVYKVLSIILHDRLSPLAEQLIGPYQAGFRKERSTTDQIFCIRQIVQKSYELNTETQHLFIDFKSAYDTINRDQLWMIMTELGIPHKLIRLLRATLDGVMCCVKVQGSVSSFFVSKRGLRQGDALSTTLFNIALEGIVRRAGINRSGTIFTKLTQLLGFADDIDIVGRNIRSVKDAYVKLEREANKIGLYVNVEKTKFLMIKPSPRTLSLVGTHLEVGNKKFEVVNEFTYLGVLINNNHDTTTEIKKRIVSATRTFYSLRPQLTSKKLSRRTKIAIYKTLIRPIALYGSESWNTTSRDEEQLGVFERRVLRTIFGPLKEENANEYRQRYNFELYQLYREPSIVKIMKINRLRWAGHVARRQSEPDEPIYRVWQSTFVDGKRNRGRPKNSWTENVEADFRALGSSNWQESAQDRQRFKKFLDAVKSHHQEGLG